MSLSKIHSALMQSVVDGDFDLPMSFENHTYTPTDSVPWMRVDIIPNQPSVVTLGDVGQDEHDGFMQLTLNYPQNEGVGNALAKADEIRDIYTAGYKPVYDDQEVTVFSCGRSQGRQIDGWFTLIITIYWKARTFRS